MIDREQRLQAVRLAAKAFEDALNAAGIEALQVAIEQPQVWVSQNVIGEKFRTTTGTFAISIEIERQPERIYPC